MIPTPEQRAEWRRLADEAYPGPWDHWPEAGWVEVTADDHGAVIAGQVRPRLGFKGEIYVDNDEPTAAFIAAAREAVPALLNALDAADAELDRLHSWAGLMELLDEHYPADLIPTAPDDPARDTGPRIVSLIRRVDAAEAAMQRVREMHAPEHLGTRDRDGREIAACALCLDADGWPLIWPCPTVRAIEGDA